MLTWRFDDLMIWKSFLFSHHFTLLFSSFSLSLSNYWDYHVVIYTSQIFCSPSFISSKSKSPPTQNFTLNGFTPSINFSPVSSFSVCIFASLLLTYIFALVTPSTWCWWLFTFSFTFTYSLFPLFCLSTVQYPSDLQIKNFFINSAIYHSDISICSPFSWD